MILCSTTGYQTHAYAEAASQMGLEVAFGSDRCHVLDDPWRDGALALHFEHPDASARQVVEYARAHRLDALIPLGDRVVPTAARAAQSLGLLSHPPEAADVCRHKFRSRNRLREFGLNVPWFARFTVDASAQAIVEQARPPFPCVLKPLALSASRGVIRAENPADFVASFERLGALLRSPDVQVMREETSRYIQVEGYIDGREIAVEGFVDRGDVTILAIFDKPDPLEGPYFEETIYVTPSRLPEPAQQEIEDVVRQTAAALGLFHGPFHAELRLNGRGVWPLEMAARSIGGLCAKALRFSSPALGNDASLEQLAIGLALGEDIRPVCREESAAGVMMIPVEHGGIYQGVDGLDEARAVRGIEEIAVTARPSQRLVPFPEGCSYPGFIFARGPSPESVEASLRSAHQKLSFKITSGLPVLARRG